jgi:hypothetical protein
LTARHRASIKLRHGRRLGRTLIDREQSSVCQADVIVSSDDDLLVLDPWHTVRIMKPAACLDRYG